MIMDGCTSFIVNSRSCALSAPFLHAQLYATKNISNAYDHEESRVALFFDFCRLSPLSCLQSRCMNQSHQDGLAPRTLLEQSPKTSKGCAIP